MNVFYVYLRCHPVRSAVDRPQQVCTVAGVVAEAAEAACAAKVYQLDDSRGHQHDVVPLQVAVNHPVQVKVGDSFQNLLCVQNQDTLWQGTKPKFSR